MSRHVAATIFLPNNDKRKFSLATPDTIRKAYKRVYDQGIAAHRMGHDIEKTIDYWKKVMKNQGLNINQVNGHRNDKGRGNGDGRPQRGGKRIKGQSSKSKWYHKDAKDCIEMMFEDHERFMTRYKQIKKEKPVFTAPPQPCMDPDAVLIKQSNMPEFEDTETAFLDNDELANDTNNGFHHL